MLEIRVLLVLGLFIFGAVSANAAEKKSGKDSMFLAINYQGIQLKVPRNWQYNSAELNNHINTATESMLKLQKIDLDQGNNQILVAGTLRMDNKRPIANLRLSVRNEPALSQKDMKVALKSEPTELDAAAKALADQGVKVLRKIDTVKKADVVSAKIKNINGNICMMSEIIVMYEDDVRINESYVCMFKNRRVKLTHSYSADTKEIVKPILDYVTSTLKVSGN